jgi:hypothetical protein
MCLLDHLAERWPPVGADVLDRADLDAIRVVPVAMVRVGVIVVCRIVVPEELDGPRAFATQNLVRIVHCLDPWATCPECHSLSLSQVDLDATSANQ